MALNDYADAVIDAVERPERPIPSGRVPRATALRVAAGLTAAGLGLAAAASGKRALTASVPLACLVWAYDLAAKSTSAGPAAMAGTRALNVLTGAVIAGEPGRAAVPAVLMGAHTYTVTALSTHEVSGANSRARSDVGRDRRDRGRRGVAGQGARRTTCRRAQRPRLLAGRARPAAKRRARPRLVAGGVVMFAQLC